MAPDSTVLLTKYHCLTVGREPEVGPQNSWPSHNHVVPDLSGVSQPAQSVKPSGETWFLSICESSYCLSRSEQLCLPGPCRRHAAQCLNQDYRQASSSGSLTPSQRNIYKLQ